jgi:hypothetical protein
MKIHVAGIRWQEIHMTYFLEHLKGRHNLGDQGAGGRIIKK